MGKYKKEHKVKVQCNECGKDIFRYPSQVYRVVYCSQDCFRSARKKTMPKCVDCGNPVSKHKHKRCVDCRNKYMVSKNHNAYIERVKVICDQCGKEIERRPNDISPHNFCDQKCMGDWKSENLQGKKASSWKGGFTPLIKKLRLIPKAVQWRNLVLNRDNDECQECGSQDHLEVHHIKEFAEIVKENNIKTLEEALLCEELWNISNGQTLCVHCHAEKHPDQRHLFKLRIA
jgi:endogenous inhibitor of DNA gyrase (YacG/DUF329 family)